MQNKMSFILIPMLPFTIINKKGTSNKFCLKNILIPMILYYRKNHMNKKTHIFIAHPYFKICSFKKRTIAMNVCYKITLALIMLI